jgi:hypothetical protein
LPGVIAALGLDVVKDQVPNLCLRPSPTGVKRAEEFTVIRFELPRDHPQTKGGDIH